ncbi:hypothetical protein [Streptomyces sp. NPDC101455]|uniref:hypothetical protein n=1 Tax=Streptomyces sp. NPDC101455 TaxID=3366142 RepID=UPI0037F11A2B
MTDTSPTGGPGGTPSCSACPAALTILNALGNSDDPTVDSGTYTSYADPVDVDGRDSRIAWGGTIGNASAEDSEHCG